MARDPEARPASSVPRPAPAAPAYTPRTSAGPKPAAPPKPAPEPRVQESFSFSEPAGPNGAAVAASSDFVAPLLRDLREAVGTVIESNPAAAVTVVFVLQADGSLGRARVIRGSGSSVLDAAVLAACARVRARGFPRELTGQEHELVFRPTAKEAR